MVKDIFITLTGRVPSKKNSKQIIYKTNPKTKKKTPIIISSKAHKQWHDEQAKVLSEAKNKPLEPLNKLEAIHVRFWSADKRKFDLDNKLSSVLDLLVDCKYIANDTYDIVPEINIKYCGVTIGGKTEIDIKLL